MVVIIANNRHRKYDNSIFSNKRDTSSCNLIFIVSSKVLFADPFISTFRDSQSYDDSSNGELYWYPLKVFLPGNKSRTFYMETEMKREELLIAILRT